MKPSHWSPRARRDADAAAGWYAGQGGLALELAFIEALETAKSTIEQHPQLGSLRHSDAMPDLPAPLRFIVVPRFDRHLVYYIDLPTHVEVIRVWHASRGLNALLEDER